MGTFNFKKQDDFTTGIYQADILYTVKDWQECNETTKTPEDEQFQIWLDEQTSFDFESYKEEIEKFNNTLNFYRITLKSGYYNGFQTIVENLADDDECRLTTIIDNNADSDYYFNMNLSTFKRKETSEFNKINKYIKNNMPQIIIVNGWCPVYSELKGA